MSLETEQFEAELQRLRPAKPPEELLEKLAAPPRAGLAHTRGELYTVRVLPGWWRRFQWLGPAVAAVIVGAVLIAHFHAERQPRAKSTSSGASRPVIKADEVEIDRQLLAAFDAVARLPGGEPVRFRCRQWMDEVVLRDAVTGVTIEQQTPRLEVVPIRFETY